jgi:RNA-dependent RNA polymerase
MDRASGAYPQRESGGTPNHGKRGGQDVRAYSISSDNSGGSGSKGRGQPILRSTLSQSYATPPKQRTKIPALSLDHEYCNHNINGNNIKETFKPRSNAYTSPHSSSKSLSPSKGSSRSHHSTPGTQDTQSRSLVKRSNDNWASDQGARVKLINIPKVYWTKDLYLAMCRYGTVVKIEMIIGSRGNDAIVTLQ